MMFTPFTWKFYKPHIICFGAQKNGLSEMVHFSTHYMCVSTVAQW